MNPSDQSSGASSTGDAARENPAGRRTTRQLGLSIFALLVLALAMFGDVLTSSDKVLSKGTEDLAQQWIPWRQFGFGQLREGNLPEWNPHVFLGVPFLAGFQSALLYPPNWLYLVAPIGLATNWLIAGHVFLSGMFMLLWAWRRGLSPLACFVAGALLMFCGPQFLRVHAGNLPHLLAMPWAPLLFLAIDGVFETRRAGWVLLGMAALAMQILAGHPQYVFCTLVAATAYSGLCLVQARDRGRIACGLIILLIGAGALSAAQLLPGIETSDESVRGARLPYPIAASFSLPPENLLMLALPGFFGNQAGVAYWGRWNLWEASLAVGAAGLTLALYGAICGERTMRRFSAPMVILLLVLAFGKYTPLFQLLYNFAPGFDKFRSVSRFAYPALLFLCMLSGIGLDRLIRSPQSHRRAALAVAGVAVLLLLVAAVLFVVVDRGSPTGIWQRSLLGIQGSGEGSIAAERYADPTAQRELGIHAVASLAIGACVLIACAGLIAIADKRQWAVYALAALAVAETFAFARPTRDTFSLSNTHPTELATFLAEHPGDYRTFTTMNPNAGMLVGSDDIWGYDSLTPIRYVELVAASQGHQTEDAVLFAHYPKFRGIHPVFKMLRLRYSFQTPGGALQATQYPIGLPRALLVPNYRVLKDREQILDAVLDPAFDATRTVILEEDPGLKLDPATAGGEARVVESSTDSLLIEAHLTAPAILLVTDGWSKNWRAVSAKDDSREYRVLPANYVLRGIPLEAGDHLIRLEYHSPAYGLGKWISGASLIAFAGAVALVLARGRRRELRTATTPG